MKCIYCESKFKADDKVVVFDSELVHEVDCFEAYVRENFATETTTYLGFLESQVLGDD